MNRELYLKLYKIYAKMLRVKNNLPIYSMKNSSYFKKNYSLDHGNKKVNLLKNLEGDRILILAPHIDDDIIGCGGAVLKYIKDNKDIHIAYLTNGNKNGNSEQRKSEAMYVASSIGINRDNLYFLSSNDKELITSNIENELINIVGEVKPDTVFLPCILDTHIDHFGASVKLINAYNESKDTFATIKRLYQYESQSPITHIYSNVTLDISDEIDKKMKILDLYPSQKINFNFFKELYRINGMFIGEKKYGECYLESTVEEFNTLYINNFSDLQDYDSIRTKLIPFANRSSMVRAYNSSIDNKKMLSEILR